jgi:hypothetical protein
MLKVVRAGHGRGQWLDIGPFVKNQLVEGVLAGGFVRADDAFIRLDAHNIARLEVAFVDGRRGNPQIAVFIQNGQVAAEVVVKP